MTWLFLFVALALSAGFAKLLAVLLNWFCAHHLSKRVVRTAKVANHLLIVAYPALLMVGLGWNGPRLLFGGSTLELSPLWWLMIAAGVIGFGLLVRSTITYQTYCPPTCQIAAESHLVDLRNDEPGRLWRETFVGSGPMRRFALLPGNEQFTIEVSTKTYEQPRLPAAWDGLSLVHLADCHFRGAVTRAYFEAVCEQAVALKPDLFVFTGDVLDDLKLLDWLPETLGRLTAPWGQYFILGNHDWYLDPGAIRREFERLGWIDVAGRCVQLNAGADSSGRGFLTSRNGACEEETCGRAFRRGQETRAEPDTRAELDTRVERTPPLILCGDETPWMGAHPDLSSAPADAFRILLSHTPDNITWAREQGIDLMLAGHTHGGQIRLPILGPVYSPSRLGCRYASGVFSLDPTLLYVSRGLSGKEPIRYNCPPELTKLVLRHR